MFRILTGKKTSITNHENLSKTHDTKDSYVNDTKHAIGNVIDSIQTESKPFGIIRTKCPGKLENVCYQNLEAEQVDKGTYPFYYLIRLVLY